MRTYTELYQEAKVRVRAAERELSELKAVPMIDRDRYTASQRSAYSRRKRQLSAYLNDTPDQLAALAQLAYYETPEANRRKMPKNPAPRTFMGEDSPSL